jgi:prepilin-type N-terminal cleavage/methylation domain-containing protein
MIQHVRDRAFALLELLTVISIVTLLAAIVFPVFVQAKREAAKTPCASNLRQIGNCFAMYAADWDDYFPTAINAWDRQNPELLSELPKPWNAISTITDLLYPYAKSTDLWHCPLDHDWFPRYGASYEVNVRAGIFGKPQSQFNQPALKLANDISGWHSGTPEWSEPYQIRWRENELFADGHVEYGFRKIAVNYE